MGGPNLRALLKSRPKIPNVDHVPIAIFCAIIRKPIERVPLILDTGGTAIVMSIDPPVVVRYEGDGRRPPAEAVCGPKRNRPSGAPFINVSKNKLRPRCDRWGLLRRNTEHALSAARNHGHCRRAS